MADLIMKTIKEENPQEEKCSHSRTANQINRLKIHNTTYSFITTELYN